MSDSKHLRPAGIRQQPVNEDTAYHKLTSEDRDRIGLDCWEPSLLRKMLEAEGKKPKQREGEQ